MKMDMPSLLLHLGQRRGARQQDHEVAVLDAADPHLLAVDHVASPFFTALVLILVVSVPVVGSVTPMDCRRHSPAGDLGQVLLLLRLRAMAQQRAHVVHLAVAGAGVAAAAVDLLHDDAGLGQAQAGAAVFLRDQRGQPAGFVSALTKASG
jgi:hypothetical protein